MVWRNNIKVLGTKAKTLPLVISMSLHVVMLFALAMASHEREKVFMVDLVFQGSGVNQQSIGARKPAPQKHMRETVYKPAALSESVKHKGLKISRNESSPAVEQNLQKADIKAAVSQTTDASPIGKLVESVSYASDLNGSDTGIRDMTIAISTNFNSRASLLSCFQGYSDEGETGKGKGVIESNFGSINSPSFLRMVKPEYPYFARRLSKEGKVVLRLFIDEHGRLVSVEIIGKAGYGFDEAAIEAVKASIFRPAKLNGHPVACKALLPVRFKLE